MNIYRHCRISEALGLRNIFELVPDFEYEQVPEDASFCGPSPFKGHRHTEEFKQRISGKGNGMYAKTHTDEARKKISQSKLGKKRKPFSDETRSIMSKNRTGRKRKYLPDGSWTWYYPS